MLITWADTVVDVDALTGRDLVLIVYVNRNRILRAMTGASVLLTLAFIVTTTRAESTTCETCLSLTSRKLATLSS